MTQKPLNSPQGGIWKNIVISVLSLFVLALGSWRVALAAGSVTTPRKARSSAVDLPCLAPCPSNSTGLDTASSDLKAFGDKKYFWRKKRLSIRFLDGDSKLQTRVMRVAKEWTHYASIDFDFGQSIPADVRVSFAGRGHWSLLGNDAENAPASRATMNLQISNSTSDDEVSRVTLHEFGHALGLMHEHRQPGNPIQWDKPVVRKWYQAPPNKWSLSEIEEQVFKPYNSATTVSNGYHPDSIMHYPVLPGWTTNGFTVGWNKTLVDSDKEFVRKWYPPSH
jgi:serralysin